MDKLATRDGVIRSLVRVSEISKIPFEDLLSFGDIVLVCPKCDKPTVYWLSEESLYEVCECGYEHYTYIKKEEQNV